MGTHPIFESDFDCLTEKMSDEEYLEKKHNPDMSDAAWDKRWEQAKQVKQKARERERKKLIKDLDHKEDDDRDRQNARLRRDSRIRIDSRSNKRRHEELNNSS